VATIAHQSNAVHLKTLTARVIGVSTAETLSGSTGSATAIGRFVVVSLAIANQADSPESFDRIGAEQTRFVGNGKSYSEDFNAENGGDPRSCVRAAMTATSIQPGESATCDVVFDLPASAIERARTDRFSLIVANFGDNIGPSTLSLPATLGVIVLNPLGNA
jgi:hypothetical protein